MIHRHSALGIDWPLDGQPILATRDAAAKPNKSPDSLRGHHHHA
jgi:dTDP-4-dehydrorhamnose 3,5-epimerase-like enzyme